MQAFPRLNSQHTLVTISVTCTSTLESVGTVHFIIHFFSFTPVIKLLYLGLSSNGNHWQPPVGSGQIHFRGACLLSFLLRDRRPIFLMFCPAAVQKIKPGRKEKAFGCHLCWAPPALADSLHVESALSLFQALTKYCFRLEGHGFRVRGAHPRLSGLFMFPLFICMLFIWGERGKECLPVWVFFSRQT